MYSQALMLYNASMNIQLLKRALFNALGVFAYVVLFAWLVFTTGQRFSGSIQSPGWLNGTLVLMLFIISASVTGSLVLLKPILLYIEGQKKAALTLFVYTISCLAIIALLVASYLVAQYRTSESLNTAQRCGGNMMNAPTCATGYHCAPEPGSHLPFGDVGGICVRD